MKKKIKFRDIKIGDTFDFVSPNIGYNSFFHECEKIGDRKYKSLVDGMIYYIGTTNCEIYHVRRKK